MGEEVAVEEGASVVVRNYSHTLHNPQRTLSSVG